jgi:hypothetical protein
MGAIAIPLALCPHHQPFCNLFLKNLLYNQPLSLSGENFI